MLIPIAKQVIKLVPEAAAVSITRVLAAQTQRPAVTPAEREALARAVRLEYGAGNAAFAWGEGPLVIFVHGWSGRAAQLAPLALEVSKHGFRAVALDVTGHGDSPKRQTCWADFLRDIPALATALGGDVFAYVAHSAGALGLMAARGLRGLTAERYACVCAPSHPFPPINVIRKKLAPRPGVMARYKQFIAEQFETTWEELETGRSYLGAGSDMLLFYDETDRFVNHSEGDKILSLCPGARLIKTSRYSHAEILAAPELQTAVLEFLTSPAAQRLEAPRTSTA